MSDEYPSFTTSFFDLFPWFTQQENEDPLDTVHHLADLVESMYYRMIPAIEGLPSLISPDFINRKYVLSGHLKFFFEEQLGAAKLSPFTFGMSVTLLLPPFQVPVPGAFNGHGLYWIKPDPNNPGDPNTDNPLAGQYRKIQYYSFLASFYGAIVDVPWDSDIVPELTVPYQIAMCYPDRVFLPDDASDVEGYYEGMFLRIDGGAGSKQYGTDVQTRKIVQYTIDGDKKIAYVSPPFDTPPDPESSFGISPTAVPLQYLGRYVGMSVPNNIPEELQRQLILNAIAIYKLKGTHLGFERLLKLLGWNSSIIEVGSNYAPAEPSHPTYVPTTQVFPDQSVVWGLRLWAENSITEPKPSTSEGSVQGLGLQPKDLLPYRAGGWGSISSGQDPKYQDRPYQTQYDYRKPVTKDPFGVGLVKFLQHDPNGSPQNTFLTGVGTAGKVNDPTTDYAADTATPFPIADSDIKLFVSPTKSPLGLTIPLEAGQVLDWSLLPTLGDLNDTIKALEDVRPIHVEIDGIGWLLKETEGVAVAEEFKLLLYLKIVDTLTISDSFSFYTGAVQPLSEGASMSSICVISREIRWDATEDSWDGGGAGDDASTWDSGVIAIGTD